MFVVTALLGQWLGGAANAVGVVRKRRRTHCQTLAANGAIARRRKPLKINVNRQDTGSFYARRF
jgi:hypothetical protein